MIDQTMEVILTRDQRTTSHRVLDRTVQSYALNSTSTLPPKYQDDIVANNRNTEATNKKTAGNNCDKKHLPYNSHLMPAFYDDRKAQKIRTAFVTFVRILSTWLSKSKYHQLCLSASLTVIIIFGEKIIVIKIIKF